MVNAPPPPINDPLSHFYASRRCTLGKRAAAAPWPEDRSDVRDAATRADFDPGVSEPHQSHQEIPAAGFAPAAKLPGKEEHLYCLYWLLGIGVRFCAICMTKCWNNEPSVCVVPSLEMPGTAPSVMQRPAVFLLITCLLKAAVVLFKKTKSEHGWRRRSPDRLRLH